MNNVVLKGKLGAGFNDDRYTLPKDGNPGDILVKTETGSEWQKQEPATSTPDWHQNNSTASDYIKNRPGGYTVNYPALNIEWDGVTGDRVSVDIMGGKFVKVSDEIPKIERLVSGVLTTKNGDVYNEQIITDRMIMDFGNSIYGSDLFLVVNKAPANFVYPGMGDVLAVFPETGVYFMRSTDSIYISSLSLHAKSEIVQIPQRYVDGLEETTANANQALETATAAQSTAEAAQSTADEAKSTADAVESLHYTLEEKNYHGVYDKKTEGRDTFKCNAFDYYKISDFAATYVEIKQFSGTNNNGTDISDVFSGKNCVACGCFIVVNAAGQCSYTNESGTFEFTAPSAGLYAMYNGATNPLTAGSYNFTFNIIAPIVTNLNTYKKYYITVDDTGTLKATEIT